MLHSQTQMRPETSLGYWRWNAPRLDRFLFRDSIPPQDPNAVGLTPGALEDNIVFHAASLHGCTLSERKVSLSGLATSPAKVRERHAVRLRPKNQLCLELCLTEYAPVVTE